MSQLNSFSKTKYSIILYKECLEENEPFLKINLRRKKDFNGLLSEKLKLLYDGPLSISEEKKKDLLSMLSLIDLDVRSFYINLSTTKNIRNAHPDLDLLEADEDHSASEGIEPKKIKNGVKKKRKEMITFPSFTFFFVFFRFLLCFALFCLNVSQLNSFSKTKYGIILYKECLEENEPFLKINLRRKRL